MYQYYIFIITKDEKGNYAHDVKWAFDVDADTARLKGESVFYDCCAKAALSIYPHHVVTLFSSDGDAIMAKKFIKKQEEQPTPSEETAE